MKDAIGRLAEYFVGRVRAQVATEVDRTNVVELPRPKPEPKPRLRSYAPGLWVTREARTDHVAGRVADPDAPPAPVNERAFSEQARRAIAEGHESARPLTEQELAELNEDPEPTPEQVAAMIAQVKGHRL